MKKTLFFLFLFIFCGLSFTSYVFAESKNIFGLHLTQTQDIESASKVINSGGGDWGWATLVIRTDQLDKNVWQDFFNKCRELHIIPIIRIAATMEQDHWKRPSISDIDSVSEFLNSLTWPTARQHIILFNEINHGSEWGGSVDIKSFTDISIYSYNKFKSLNKNFYILSTGLDLAAPEKPDQFKSAANVYREIYVYRPEYFDHFDALASHSYPNHGYIGTPNETGQHSIRGYQWELNFIKSLGIQKTYPVFITETGWPHREGEKVDNNYYTAETASKFLITALDIWQKDPRIIAVTPFIYNYPYEPFDHFSWLNKEEKLYPSYQKILSLPKTKNSPPQTTIYEIVRNELPFLLFSDIEYPGKITLKNAGQSIWGEKTICLTPQSTANVTLDAICTSDQLTLPGRSQTFNYKIKINSSTDHQDKTFISWENIAPLEIVSINDSGSIYSPKTTFYQKTIQFFNNLFK